MDINSTDEERYNELKDRTLDLLKWNYQEERNIEPINSNETTRQVIYRYYDNKNISKLALNFEGFNNKLYLSRRSIKETLRVMDGLRLNSNNLNKLLTVLDKVVDNAVLIDIEPYRHQSRKKSEQIECEMQYMSVFSDERTIYPVKFAIERHIPKEINNSNIYCVITVGEIPKEKGSARTGVQVENSTESLHTVATSSIISITSLIEMFNENQGVLLKNLPNQMLSKEQIVIKQKVIEHDKRNEEKNKKINEMKSKIKNMQKELEKDEFNYQFKITKEPKETKKNNKQEGIGK